MTGTKKFVQLAVLGLVGFCLSPAARTEDAIQAIQHPMTAPLDPGDPRAIDLDDPALYPPADIPAEKRSARFLSTAVAETAENYDVVTGAVIKTRPVRMMGVRRAVPGSPGSVPIFDSERIAAGLGFNRVFGTDDRKQVCASGCSYGPTTAYPWRTQCKLNITWKNGSTAGCSGTLIGSRTVITAGHCVYNSGKGGWAKTIRVRPGKDGTYDPYGSAYASVLHSWTGWTSSNSSDHDMGVITLGTNIGNTTGWLGFEWASSFPSSTTLNIAGYPGDKPSGTQWYDYDPLKAQTTYRFYYRVDTYSGQSGSGVYRFVGDDRYVMAAHSGYNYYLPLFGEYNRGTRITQTKFNHIVGWL